jgi:iron complex transport system ATP-binding protein
MAAVELDRVSAGYGGVAVLRDVTLAFEAGQLAALVGSNGAGKSTLLRTIAGLCPCLAGSTRLMNEDTRALTRKAYARKVAIVSQRVEVATGFSVREVVAMGRAPHQLGWLREARQDREIVDKTLAECDLSRLADRAIDSLSGGEQQRVHIARALVQDAPILLLDEAAAHLDIRHACAIYELVRRLVREKKLVGIAAMHDLSAAARHADTAILLNVGTVIASGPIETTMTPELLSRAFGVRISLAKSPEGLPFFAPAP